MFFLGIDAGSSSIKVSLLEGESGRIKSSMFWPENEMDIISDKDGWAEQDPDIWWRNLKTALKGGIELVGIKPDQIIAIGISYQMHGLVAVDRDRNPVRNSIIWCDSRGVEYGEKAYAGIGKEFCLNKLLNSPGNFTASKLAWVRENEPDIYSKIYRILLPGDYLVMKLTGEVTTTTGGLSEGIFWDFENNELSGELMDWFGFSPDLIPPVVPSFGEQGYLSKSVANELGLKPGIPVSYRAGDQPNNAFSLNVNEPGDIAATAGTSGVLYAVSDQVISDPELRINTFAHVNHSPHDHRLGILACINGTGIMNSWIRRVTGSKLNYSEMNKIAQSVEPGSCGLLVFPFGNGAERLLKNRNPGAMIRNLNLNLHREAHLYRSVQEGIAFSFRYAIDILKKMGIEVTRVRAGNTNMFLSPLFAQILANLGKTSISIINTEGSAGAARGAGIGSGYYSDFTDAFRNIEIAREIEPDDNNTQLYNNLFDRWLTCLENSML